MGIRRGALLVTTKFQRAQLLPCTGHCPGALSSDQPDAALTSGGDSVWEDLRAGPPDNHVIVHSLTTDNSRIHQLCRPERGCKQSDFVMVDCAILTRIGNRKLHPLADFAKRGMVINSRYTRFRHGWIQGLRGSLPLTVLSTVSASLLENLYSAGMRSRERATALGCYSTSIPSTENSFSLWPFNRGCTLVALTEPVTWPAGVGIHWWAESAGRELGRRMNLLD